MTLDPVQSASRLSPYPRHDLAIARRWTEWEAAVIIWLRRRLDVPSIDAVRRSHREWMLDLLSRSIPLWAIRRNLLDDPREPRLVLMARAEAYTERRQPKRKEKHSAARERETMTGNAYHDAHHVRLYGRGPYAPRKDKSNADI